MKIFLIGFMGCGKTTLGKKIAARLGYPFIDLDEVFEARHQATVPQYFKDHGEDAFRQAESKLLKTEHFPSQAVIATGGGAPCFFDNMGWMNAAGLTIYIQLSPQALASRLEKAEEVRPVLRDLKGPALLDFITRKLADRESSYNKAHMVLNGISLTAEKAVAAIDNYQRR